jgi:uncharacterized delta-60 repeat protein
MKASRPRVLVLAALLGSSAASGALRVDESFGGGVASVFGSDAAANGVAIQPDGKVVAVGTAIELTHGVILARFTPEGVLDPNFGNGGLAKLFPSPPADYSGNAVAIDSAGRIVVAGAESSGRFLLARFLSNGSPDPAFGTGGLVLTGFPGAFATATSLAIQADGKIVAAGGAVTGTAGDFGAARYLVDGSLDASFGSGGRAVLDFGGTFYEFASGVVIRGDGRIVLGGRTDGAAGYAMALAQLLADGLPDASFGTAGKLVLPIAQSIECNGLLLQPDGKVVAGGPAYPFFGSLVVRLLANGSLDPAFGAAGVAQVPVVAANAIALDGGGRIVVGGSAAGGMALTRLLPNGALDPGVGPDGYVRALGGAPPQIAAGSLSLAVQPDGRILLAGWQELVTIQLLTVVRFVDGLVAPIPTLSGLGLAILGMGLALAAALVLRRS